MRRKGYALFGWEEIFVTGYFGGICQNGVDVLRGRVLAFLAFFVEPVELIVERRAHCWACFRRALLSDRTVKYVDLIKIHFSY